MCKKLFFLFLILKITLFPLPKLLINPPLLGIEISNRRERTPDELLLKFFIQKYLLGVENKIYYPLEEDFDQLLKKAESKESRREDEDLKNKKNIFLKQLQFIIKDYSELQFYNKQIYEKFKFDILAVKFDDDQSIKLITLYIINFIEKIFFNIDFDQKLCNLLSLSLKKLSN